MANEFLTPYSASKFLEGVEEALPKIRGTLLQDTVVPGFVLRNANTVNIDKEFAIKNTTAMFAEPKADVTPIQLGDFSTKELSFAYIKEGWDDNDPFDALDQRMLGDQFGQVNPQANKVRRLIEKAATAEQRFQNLFEKTLASMVLYGGYEAYSEKHHRVQYDFERNVTTTYAQLSSSTSLISSVNLTTSAVTAPWIDVSTGSAKVVLPVVATSGGFTAGDKAWTRALVTAGKASPVNDLRRMYETSARWGAVPSYYIMSDDAYDAFAFDVTTNYSKEADLTLRTTAINSLPVQSDVKNIDGLTQRTSWTFTNGVTVPIYTYNAVLNNRTTGVEEAIIGSGWVVGVPSSSYGLKVYGRILHPKAGYYAMPRFINNWSDDKAGTNEYEMHANFLVAHKKINALTAWKVV